jgi:uncharacterized phiE125 gp8 family phage protein
MTSYLLAGPAGEPLTLAETKAYLRLDDEAEDALVTTLITAARLHVEGVTGRALMAQSWRLIACPAEATPSLPSLPRRNGMMASAPTSPATPSPCPSGK